MVHVCVDGDQLKFPSRHCVVDCCCSTGHTHTHTFSGRLAFGHCTLFVLETSSFHRVLTQSWYTVCVLDSSSVANGYLENKQKTVKVKKKNLG